MNQTLSRGQDFRAWVLLYLAHCVEKPFCKMHHEWFDLTANRYLAIMAPRGFAKSHCFSYFYPLYAALESKKDIVLVSSTEANAEWFLEKIANEVETNEKIKEDYGDVRGKIWRNTFLEFGNTGSTIRCAGSEGKIRGKRPDILVLDDLENDKNVLSSTWRKEKAEWFWKAALYTLKPDGQVIVVGTPTHPMSLISDLVKNDTRQGWTRKVYQGLVDGKSVWEEQWPTPELLKRRDLNPAAFEQEIQCNPIPDEWRKFKPEKFKFYERLPQGLVYTTTVDCAFELHSKADYTVVMTCGMDDYGNRYIVEYTKDRLLTNEIIDTIFRHIDRWNPLRLGIQKTILEKTLKYYFDIECKKRGRYLNIVEISVEGTRKNYRIEALVPYINNGAFWFHKDHKDLLDDLTCWPTVEHDDLVEAMAMQLDVMEKPSPNREQLNPNCLRAMMDKVEARNKTRRLWHP